MGTDELPAPIDGTHPAVPRVNRVVSFEWGPGGQQAVSTQDPQNLFGHGTACGGVIRRAAPDAAPWSMLFREIVDEVKSVLRAAASNAERKDGGCSG